MRVTPLCGIGDRFGMHDWEWWLRHWHLEAHMICIFGHQAWFPFFIIVEQGQAGVAVGPLKGCAWFLQPT